MNAQCQYDFDFAADPSRNWTYGHDAASRLTNQTDAKGQATALTYDVLGRVLTKTVTAAGLAPETTTNTYDLARTGYFNLGRLTRAIKSVATQTLNGVVLPAVNVPIA